MSSGLNTILTSHGRYFNLLAPEEHMFSVDEIGHSLANLCRFTGHTSRFYSVAQHSVLVSRTVPPHLALEGLLHDAAEAYCGDVSRPLKMLLPDYRAVEERIERAVLQWFGLKHPLPTEVKVADNTLLATELRDLMPDRLRVPHIWGTHTVQPLEQRIEPMSPTQAHFAFVSRFDELQRARCRA